MRQLFALVILGLAASFAQAQLRVGDVQPCQGPLGPAREPVYDRYDDVFVRGKVFGAKANADGIVSVDIQGDIFGPDGNKLEHTSGTVKHPLPLNDQVPLNFHFGIKPTWAPGKYTAKLMLKDNESGSETSFTQELTVLTPRFAILPPQFFFDKEGQSPAPNGGFSAQTVHYKWWVVGLDISKGSVDCDVVAEIRDRTGKNVLRQIMKVRSKESDAEKLKELTYVTNSGILPLGSPGDFVLHMVATDYMAGKMVTCDFPLHIEAPGIGMRFEGGSREVSPPPSASPSTLQVSSPPK